MCNFHIDQIKGRLVKRQLKMLGMVEKKLYRTTLMLVTFDLCNIYVCLLFLFICLFALSFQAQAAKVEKTKMKNIMKKERKTIRTIIKVERF